MQGNQNEKQNETRVETRVETGARSYHGGNLSVSKCRLLKNWGTLWPQARQGRSDERQLLRTLYQIAFQYAILRFVAASPHSIAKDFEAATNA
jgi:hypothetical protein